MALQFGQASDSEGKTAKVRDRAQPKAQLEVLQPGTVGMSGFHPAQQCHEHNLTLLSTRDTHNQHKAPWSLCFRELVSLWAQVTHTGARKLSKHRDIKVFLQQGLEKHSWRSHGLDYTQEGAQRVSGGTRLSSNSTIKAES